MPNLPDHIRSSTEERSEHTAPLSSTIPWHHLDNKNQGGRRGR